MLPDDENAVVWSVRMPAISFTGAVEVLADDTYQIAVIDKNMNEWARFLPTHGSLPEAIEKLQILINGVVDEFVTRSRLGFPPQDPSATLF